MSSEASNSVISAHYGSILANTSSSGNEYGTEKNLTSPNSLTSYINTTVRTDGQTSHFQSNFSWNSTEGYTIGMSHGHPNGMSPSPADVIWILQRTADAELVAAGSNAVQTYKDRVSVTVVTSNSTYVVTVNDWNTLMTVFSSGDATSLNNTYLQKAEQYQINNQGVSNVVASEYAVMSTFGNAINLYKAPAGSTDFAPMQVNSNGILATISCP